jgi:gas vesicle protein
MGRLFRIVAGMVVGATIGAGLVLLFTPRSGVDTQQMIRERVEAILLEGRQAADTRRLELQTQFEALKQPSSSQ